MPGSFWCFIVFVYGAIVGSFLNVLIYRMPLGLSVVTPPSRCPRCKTQLGFWDNIPLLSFLFLGARCRYCRTPISWRYFTVELLSASLWVALYGAISGDYGITWVNYVAHALFGSILIAVIFVDLDHFIIPDELNWAGTAIAIGRDVVCLGLARFAGDVWQWREFAPDFLYFGWLPKSLVGAAVYGGLLFLVSFFGFVYYAREENETVSQVARRFFIWEEETETVVVSETAAASVHTAAPAASQEEPSDEEEEGEPARLRFSPGFTLVLAALLVAPVFGYAAPLVVLLPLAGFLAYSRREGEALGAAALRFFRSAEEPAPEPMPTEAAVYEAEEPQDAENALASADAVEQPAGGSVTLSETDAAALMAEEADRFALEAETGKFGGMGLGDVKLAIAIGALLGPGPAVLSLLFATAAGAVVGIALAAIHGKGLRIGVPFGPFMAIGAIIVMLYGETIVRWYLTTVGLA